MELSTPGGVTVSGIRIIISVSYTHLDVYKRQVVIAAMIAAGGLGEIVLKGITQMKIGLGFEGGIAVVILAIILDRITPVSYTHLFYPVSCFLENYFINIIVFHSCQIYVRRKIVNTSKSSDLKTDLHDISIPCSSFVAVSYTHLDVYKRQPRIFHIAQDVREVFLRCQCYYDVCSHDWLVYLPRKGNHLCCLLYTSRCV